MVSAQSALPSPARRLISRPLGSRSTLLAAYLEGSKMPQATSPSLPHLRPHPTLRICRRNCHSAPSGTDITSPMASPSSRGTFPPPQLSHPARWTTSSISQAARPASASQSPSGDSTIPHTHSARGSNFALSSTPQFSGPPILDPLNRRIVVRGYVNWTAIAFIFAFGSSALLPQPVVPLPFAVAILGVFVAICAIQIVRYIGVAGESRRRLGL